MGSSVEEVKMEKTESIFTQNKNSGLQGELFCWSLITQCGGYLSGRGGNLLAHTGHIEMCFTYSNMNGHLAFPDSSTPEKSAVGQEFGCPFWSISLLHSISLLLRLCCIGSSQNRRPQSSLRFRRYESITLRLYL